MSDDHDPDDSLLPVTRKTARRVRRGYICGAATRSGRACLKTPIAPGRRCTRHDPAGDPETKVFHHRYPGMPSLAQGKNARTPASALLQIFQGNMGLAERQLLTAIQLASETPTLEDNITFANMRLVALFSRYEHGEITQEAFDKQAAALNDELRKLRESNAKIKQIEVELRKASPKGFGDDRFDPSQEW